MSKLLGALAAAIFVVGCSHSQPTPDETQQQQPAPTPPPPAPMPQQQPPPPPPPPANPPPMHGGAMGGGTGQMPKGAMITQQQAEQTAVGFAQQHALLPGAMPVYAEFKNGAWLVTLHGQSPNPNAVTKMTVVVGNDGRVRSHVVMAPGSPGWNQTR